MIRTVRWSLLLMAAFSIACISVPLPSGGPKLEKITLPVAGDEATAVRQTFGEPQRLDTPSNWVYEWTTERKFVIVPVMPTGMPAGAAVAGNQYRMLVEVGSDGRVVRVACTAREAPEDGVPPLKCESPTGPLRSRASTLFAYRLDSKPGFEKVDFFQPELTGAATPMVLSPDGRLLAATDRKNRLWIVDTESGEIVLRHEGEPVKFFSLAPPGQVNAVFTADGRGVAILDLPNDYARIAKQGYRFSPDGRWLAHNTGRHLEIWPSAGLFSIAEGRLSPDVIAPSWVALMPFTNRKDEEEKGHMPIAFRDDGEVVAAASQVAIHVWRMDGGEPIALVGALSQQYHHPSSEYSIGEAAADSWGVLRVIALALAPDNRLTAVFADSNFNIYVGAWQIEE